MREREGGDEEEILQATASKAVHGFLVSLRLQHSPHPSPPRRHSCSLSHSPHRKGPIFPSPETICYGSFFLLTFWLLVV